MWITEYYTAKNWTLPNVANATLLENEINWIGIKNGYKLLNGYLNMITASEVVLLSYPSLILVSVVLCSTFLLLKSRWRAWDLGVLDGEDVHTQFMLTDSREVIKEGQVK